MKKIGLLLTMICTLLLAACNDDPKITFFEHSGTYTFNDGKLVDVTFNGFSITDKSSGVVFHTNGGKIATVTLMQIVPGHGNVTVGGVVVETAPEGNGIVFQGQMALSETELMTFKGSIIDGKMTLDIQTVPIEQ